MVVSFGAGALPNMLVYKTKKRQSDHHMDSITAAASLGVEAKDKR